MSHSTPTLIQPVGFDLREQRELIDSYSLSLTNSSGYILKLWNPMYYPTMSVLLRPDCMFIADTAELRIHTCRKTLSRNQVLLSLGNYKTTDGFLAEIRVSDLIS